MWHTYMKLNIYGLKDEMSPKKKLNELEDFIVLQQCSGGLAIIIH
jgi:hypothetical protein